jgi:hypothetical protein
VLLTFNSGSATNDLIFSSLIVNRWGPQFEKATYKNRQRLYLSEQASAPKISCSFSFFCCRDVLKLKFMVKFEFRYADGSS